MVGYPDDQAGHGDVSVEEWDVSIGGAVGLQAADGAVLGVQEWPSPGDGVDAEQVSRVDGCHGCQDHSTVFRWLPGCP